MDDRDTERISARLLRVEEAANLLCIGRTKAYELIATGQLHAVRLGRATRISSREVDRFIRSVDRQPHPPRRTSRRPKQQPGDWTLFDPDPPSPAA